MRQLVPVAVRWAIKDIQKKGLIYMSYYAKKKEEQDKKIQAALEARRNRTSYASENSAGTPAAEKRKAFDSKMQAALDARSKRIQRSKIIKNKIN